MTQAKAKAKAKNPVGAPRKPDGTQKVSTTFRINPTHKAFLREKGAEMGEGMNAYLDKLIQDAIHSTGWSDNS